MSSMYGSECPRTKANPSQFLATQAHTKKIQRHLMLHQRQNGTPQPQTQFPTSIDLIRLGKYPLVGILFL